MQACVPGAGLEPLLPFVRLGLIRAGLAEARGAAEELQQKAVGGCSWLNQVKWTRAGGGPAEPNLVALPRTVVQLCDVRGAWAGPAVVWIQTTLAPICWRIKEFRNCRKEV